jgi:hypothetical protein
MMCWPSESVCAHPLFCLLADSASSHELYIYNNTLDMYKNFVPKFNGRYLSSNVNITVTDDNGKNISVPVGCECCFSFRLILANMSTSSPVYKVQDRKRS